jgi:ribosomal protein L7/L12
VKWLILLVALGILIFALGARFGANRRGASVAFLPVKDLPTDVRSSIERDLATGLNIRAVKTYRRATGASISAAKSAVDIHERRISGTSGDAS